MVPRYVIAVIALVVLAAGCGRTAAAGAGRSAVAGRIFSSGCPAERQGQTKCGSWFVGTVRILLMPECAAPAAICDSTSVVATTRSDRAGRFRVSLPPGRYAVEAVGLFNKLPSQTFNVRAGRAVQIRVSIANGIE